MCVSSLGISSPEGRTVSEGREVRDAGEDSVREGRTCSGPVSEGRGCSDAVAGPVSTGGGLVSTGGGFLSWGGTPEAGEDSSRSGEDVS